jgi:hypothetical protein
MKILFYVKIMDNVPLCELVESKYSCSHPCVLLCKVVDGLVEQKLKC